MTEEKLSDLIADLIGELRHRLEALERSVAALELTMVRDRQMRSSHGKPKPKKG